MSSIYRVTEAPRSLSSLVGKIVVEKPSGFWPVPDVFKHSMGHTASAVQGWTLGRDLIEPLTLSDATSEGRPTRGQWVVAAATKVTDRFGVIEFDDWYLGMVDDPRPAGEFIFVRRISDDGVVDYTGSQVPGYAWVNVENDYLPATVVPPVESSTAEADRLRALRADLGAQVDRLKYEHEEFKQRVATTALDYARSNGLEDGVRGLLAGLGIEHVEEEPPMWKFEVVVRHTVTARRAEGDRDTPDEAFIRASISNIGSEIGMDSDWEDVSSDVDDYEVNEVEKAEG